MAMEIEGRLEGQGHMFVETSSLSRCSERGMMGFHSVAVNGSKSKSKFVVVSRPPVL